MKFQEPLVSRKLRYKLQLKIMEAIKGSVIDGKNVYLRGFGSFVVKKN